MRTSVNGTFWTSHPVRRMSACPHPPAFSSALRMAVIGVRRKNRICVCETVLDHPGLPPEPSPFAKRFCFRATCRSNRHENSSFLTLALALALGFAMPAFAGDVTAAKNAADCEKAGGTWDATKNVCSEKKM